MNDTHEELRNLITRVVTGDGQQQENLSMRDEDWKREAEDQTGDEGMINISLLIEQWIEMLDVARNHTDTHPNEEG